MTRRKLIFLGLVAVLIGGVLVSDLERVPQQLHKHGRRERIQDRVSLQNERHKE